MQERVFCRLDKSPLETIDKVVSLDFEASSRDRAMDASYGRKLEVDAGDGGVAAAPRSPIAKKFVNGDSIMVGNYWTDAVNLKRIEWRSTLYFISVNDCKSLKHSTYIDIA